jgi:hypothetical protein
MEPTFVNIFILLLGRLYFELKTNVTRLTYEIELIFILWYFDVFT